MQVTEMKSEGEDNQEGDSACFPHNFCLEILNYKDLGNFEEFRLAGLGEVCDTVTYLFHKQITTGPTKSAKYWNLLPNFNHYLATTTMFHHFSRTATRCLVSSPRRRISSTSHLFADPWPLPHTPEHLASTVTPSGVNPMPPLERPNEKMETLRARLVYQSRKRGTLESDLLLSTFARDHLGSMSHEEMMEYDKLLDEPDWDIYYWATSKRTAPERWAGSPLLEKLRVHARNEGKVVRKMPAL